MKWLLVLVFSSFLNSVYCQEWNINLENAESKAKSEHKNILLVFSGSDWCAPCIKLDKNIWQTDIFKQTAIENWILVKADFPKSRKNALPKEIEQQNAILAEKYNPEGFFPLVVILDADGKVLGKTGFENISAEAYTSKLKSLTKSGI